jgi:D-alanine-D-alanine ligase
MSSKPNIAFITGGYSGEAEISYKSAVTFMKYTDKEKYNVYRIDITPDSWFYLHEGEKVEVDKNDFSISPGGKKITFDAVLIGIHGTPGEDGKLQGYFDILGLPYTSCDATTSALTFNKRYTVSVAAFSGIHVARSLHLFRQNKYRAEDITAALTLPVFVKPNNGGSSIGMSKVNHPEEIETALEKAFHEDDQVIVEEYIKGREFTVGVFRSGGKITVLPITEVISEKEFFDFEAKYQGKSKEITPAELDEENAGKIRRAAEKIYSIFNCNGVVRIDFILNEQNKEPYMLEINTVPGQSEASIIPQQVRAMGWNLTEFYSALIDDALSRRKSS